MTIGREMLQAAKRGAVSLDPTFAARIIDRINCLTNADGGYRGRSSASDLYYTVFAMKLLLLLNAELPVGSIKRYLQSFDGGEELDLVHLSCLARCWANLPDKELSQETRRKILDRISSCRTGLEGFANQPGDRKTSIYSSFMAFSAFQDLDEEMPDRDALTEWLFSKEAEEEGFARTDSEAAGLTPVTSGAIVLLKYLNADVPKSASQWLLGRHCNDGGFFAASMLPMPDLLSTATALHALSSLRTPIDEIREPCLNFIHTLQRDDGFCGMLVEDTVDCEYTFYGLLALGHLV